MYDYARRYFSLPEPHKVYIEDAREWLWEHAPLAAENKYDYVVHDCFSGGGVPGHLYTLEFWEKLKGIVKSDGVVTVVRDIVLILNGEDALIVNLEFCGQAGQRTSACGILDVAEEFWDVPRIP